MRLDKNSVREICMDRIRREWLSAPDTFPDFLVEISPETKADNELYIKNVSDVFQKQIKRFPVHRERRAKWSQKTLCMLTDVLCEETIIGVHRSMDKKRIDAFLEELRIFLRHVRTFAPELPLEGIGQAIRNYVVYAMFNEIHRVETGFSTACFGYSMLYPFTDNYIDSLDHSSAEKLEYNRIIRDTIEGREAAPKTPHQMKTCQLLQMIEAAYPRDCDTSVYRLLLMMLEAQEDSLRQQDAGSLLSADERLDISLYKGGVSVLIDRYFVPREMTQEELVFYFGFGFFLQLADDLQDIEDDSVGGSQTLFTVEMDSAKAEKIVNKLLQFVHKLLGEYQAQDEIFKNFVLSNCNQLIYSSLLRSKAYFSREYLEQIEKYFPVTFAAYENMNRAGPVEIDGKVRDKYMRIMDEMILEV